MLKTFLEFVDGFKPWKAKKADIIKFWTSLKPNLPIIMNPVAGDHKGTRFRADGIRVTGSPQFINSVMSRIKDLANYENDRYRLDIEYRQIESKIHDDSVGTPEYVFYVHLVNKGD